MEIAHFFLSLIAILLSAKLFAELFAFFKLPAVLGEVVAGLLLGPSLLGWVHVDNTVMALAEIGILLLLFEVGLDTDLAQLMSVGAKSMAVAITGIVVPALLISGAGVYLLGYSNILSIFIGGTFVATSIGISMRVLMEMNKHQTKTARIVLGAAVLDDIAGVLLLAMLADLAVNHGSVDIPRSAAVFGYIIGFLLLAPLAAKLLVPLMTSAHGSTRTRGLVPTLTVSLILALAVAAHGAGAPMMLGAFAAGIALSRHFFFPALPKRLATASIAREVEVQLKPVIDLFVPVFFFVVGASVDLSAVDFSSGGFWAASGLLFVLAVVGKVASGLWAEGSMREKLFCGMAMVPRGEVGLIFAEVGRKSGVLDESLFAVTVFVVALTTLAAPLAMRLLARRL